MLPFSKMSDEDLETVTGGMIVGLEEISNDIALIPIPGGFTKPQPGEDAKIILY